MDEDLTRRVPLIDMLLQDELPQIREAQRLAAADVDIRFAMSEVWWSALRIGLRLPRDLPLVLPGCPFSALEMQEAGYLPGDF